MLKGKLGKVSSLIYNLMLYQQFLGLKQFSIKQQKTRNIFFYINNVLVDIPYYVNTSGHRVFVLTDKVLFNSLLTNNQVTLKTFQSHFLKFSKASPTQHVYLCKTLVFANCSVRKSTYAVNFQGAVLFLEHYPGYVLSLSVFENLVSSIGSVAQLEWLCVKSALVNLVSMKDIIFCDG